MLSRSQVRIDGQDFRRALGSFASGVTIVTAMDGDEPVGMTCQSFFSLSLDPPLIAFAPGRESTTYPRIRRAGWFAINVLAEGSGEVARQFSRSGVDKWDGIGWLPGRSGAPILEGNVATVECRWENELPGGDHFVVIGRVLDLDHDRGQSPLLFFRGEFSSLTSGLTSG